jgi:hypothetical protein
MANKRTPIEQLRIVLEAYERIGNKAAAARELAMDRMTFMSRLDQALLRRDEMAADKPFEVPCLPDETLDADTLLDQREKHYGRVRDSKLARKLIPVKLAVDGPFGIVHMGDPHVDDDGTNIGLIRSHVRLINQTDALFGANVGDYSNNWVGRLARLYGEQGTSAREAWVLVEWLIRSVQWLYLVGGNHDVWSGAGDPVRWLSTQHNVLYQWHGARLALRCPNGREIRVNARHDFRGHSMWNTAHGPAKAVQMGWRDHILTCGHTHTSGYQVLRDPATGLISHAIRVGSYKAFDRYAEEKGLPDQCIFVAPTTIIDPQYADDDVRLVTTIFDPEHAADYLTWLRAKRKAPSPHRRKRRAA